MARHSSPTVPVSHRLILFLALVLVTTIMMGILALGGWLTAEIIGVAFDILRVAVSVLNLNQ